jgi:hypothetical protein
MTDISTGQETKAKVNFCPECGSPSISQTDSLVLSGAAASIHVSCEACEWVGTAADLLAVPFAHELGDDANILKVLMGELRVTMAKYCAVPLGGFLMKWGFLEQEHHQGQVVLNRQQLARYMTAISKAILTTVIEERRKMNEEKHGGS